MLQPYLIPLTPAAQSFSITLGGIAYNLTVRWNAYSECWSLDIRDDNEQPVLLGIPIITGLDLLYQYQYLGFGGSLIAQTYPVLDEVPTLTNLGINSQLYFVTGAP